jgi:hypothetical protein
MDIKDVFKFYNKTGDVVSTAFFCIFSYAIADLEKYDNISLSDVAVFANNITISFVQMIKTRQIYSFRISFSNL